MIRTKKAAILLTVPALLCGIVIGVLGIIYAQLAGTTADQQIAQLWQGGDLPYAQVSCFLPEDAQLTSNTVSSIRTQIDEALLADSMASEDPNVRVWIDATSAEATVSVGETGEIVTSHAYITGGDFFFFHPLSMMSGSTYQEDDLMEDGVVLNRALAWQLYGGYDLTGMPVSINGTPCIIVGVTDGPMGEAERSTSAQDACIYFSERLAEKLGLSANITCYEAILPDPLEHYAINLLQKALGTQNREYVVNTGRYSLRRSFQTLSLLDTMVQRTDSIFFPYWENAARAVQSKCALLACLLAFFAVWPAIVILLWLFTGIRALRNLHLFRRLGKWFDHIRAKRYYKKHPTNNPTEQTEETT